MICLLDQGPYRFEDSMMLLPFIKLERILHYQSSSRALSATSARPLW